VKAARLAGRTFTAYYVSTVPGQMPDALSGKGQRWIKVMRLEMEESYKAMGAWLLGLGTRVVL